MVRCAVYTRKSSEEGLEQDFNSLHAQREACAAYVMSQASEGWVLLERDYDDGGLSGGTLERPALQRLLADIAAGLIDIVVVYKVDRLTRSLLDFAKLVEAFDKSGTSFVSITQSFNTTTSMGRLTLNMLLSFAQFEREVTAERIRDKLAASKAKGMWMGGMPPIGYRAHGRSLAVVETHAGLVRDIFARYRRLGNVRLVADQLKAEGIHVPRRTSGSGRAYGGKPFTRGQLYHILNNPIYAGQIPHKGKRYPGNHPSLIEPAAWEAVQRQLASHVKTGHVQGNARSRTSAQSPLAGRIFDGAGEPLIATHTTKGGRTRYRYYVSRALHHKTGDSGMRLAASEVEAAAAAALAGLLGDPLQLAERGHFALTPAAMASLAANAPGLAARLRESGDGLASLVDRLEVSETGLTLSINAAELANLLGLKPSADCAPSLLHHAPVRLTRTGRVLRFVQANGARMEGEHGASPALLRLLARAQAWWEELKHGQLDPSDLARREGKSVSYVGRVVRLAFLSPRVIEGALAGRLRPDVDATALLKAGNIALDWEEQEKRLIVI